MNNEIIEIIEIVFDIIEIILLSCIARNQVKIFQWHMWDRW